LGGIPVFQYYRDIHLLNNRIEQKTIRLVYCDIAILLYSMIIAMRLRMRQPCSHNAGGRKWQSKD